MRIRPLTFRTKLLLSHVALVVAVVGLVSLVLERSLASDLEHQQGERLIEQARGSTEWVSSGRHPQRVAARLAAIVQSDVTIFDRSGCIIGSSSGEDDTTDADGKCLPPAEVNDARTGGLGRATRPRDDDRLHYVAVLADDDIVVRLAVSSREIEGPIAAMRRHLLFAALIAAAAAFVLGLFAARLTSRPLRSMSQQADRIAQGDYDVRFPPLPRDEFGHLADTLAALASKLSQDMERIRKLEITRRDFVANVTHELRTPTAAIQGLAETLSRPGVPPDKAAQFVELMHRHAQRLSALIDGLLQLAELDDAPGQAIACVPVIVHGVARDVSETLRARSTEAGVTVRIDVDEACVVSADPGRLEQVLVNLVDNALKYGRAGGSVTVHARTEGGRVTIRVEDDGPGIDPSHLPRLFERFYRVDVGRSREKGGAGLGLAIVKHLVETMGGTVRVESQVGKGTRVFVELEAP